MIEGAFPFKKDELPENIRDGGNHVYLIYENTRFLYVGFTQNLASRFRDHNTRFTTLGATTWYVETYDDQLDAEQREAGLIYFCQPPFNVAGKDYLPKFLKPVKPPRRHKY